jgi:hypothetical protein
MVGVHNSTPSSRRQYHLYHKKRKSHAGSIFPAMPRHYLTEILTVDMRSGAGDEIVVILHPTVLAVVPVYTV